MYTVVGIQKHLYKFDLYTDRITQLFIMFSQIIMATIRAHAVTIFLIDTDIEKDT